MLPLNQFSVNVPRGTMEFKMNMQMVNTAIEFTQTALAMSARHAAIKYNLTRIDTSDLSLTPTTGKAIFAMYNSPNFFVLKTEQASNPLLGLAANDNYRFLHDLDHALNYESGHGTIGLKDELYLNCLMSKRVFDMLNQVAMKCDRKSALYAAVIVFCDLVEQARYYDKHKAFIPSQKSFVLSCLEQYSYIFDMIEAGQTFNATQELLLLWRECGVLVGSK